MTLADIIILIIVLGLVFGIIAFLIYQNKRSCSGCAYAKNCETFCTKISKTDEKQ